MKLEEKKFPRKLKGIAKGLEISGFGIVEYSVRSESARMIALRAPEYYVPSFPKDLRSFPLKAFVHQKDTRVTSYIIVMMSKMVMRSLI